MRRRITTLLFALALAPQLAPAARATAEKEAGYHEVVRLVESHYHVKHVGIPLLANAGIKTAKIVSSTVRKYSRFADLKLAVFEDQEFARNAASEFHALMRRTLEPRWSPLVVVRGVDEGQTYTYTREDKGKFRVLICVVGERDGTVLEVGLNEAEFMKLLMNPEGETKSITDEATSEGSNDN